MNIKVKICDKAIELIDLLANMPLADDEFVDEIIASTIFHSTQINTYFRARKIQNESRT